VFQESDPRGRLELVYGILGWRRRRWGTKKKKKLWGHLRKLIYRKLFSTKFYRKYFKTSVLLKQKKQDKILLHYKPKLEYVFSQINYASIFVNFITPSPPPIQTHFRFYRRG
jgi:hypothetical protein